MKKNGILTLLFAFIPGAGQMYQGYMKRGLSLVLMAAAISMAAMLIPPIAFALLVVFMYSFFDTFNLRAQISMGTAPEDDYLVHFDPQDKRLARMMMDSHKLVGWCLIAIGALIAYEQIIMNTLGDILWRWGQKAPVWRAIYLVMDQLPEVVLCVALILCGIWLVRGPRAKKAAPEAAPEETDFQEYQPEKKMPSLLDHFARKAEPDTTGEVTLDPEDEDDGREDNTAERPAPKAPESAPVRRVGTLTMGLALVVVGAALCVGLFFPNVDFLLLFKLSPLVLVALGCEVIFRGVHSQRHAAEI